MSGTNPVATFDLPISTGGGVQDPTTYKGTIDAAIAVGMRIVDNFAPRQTTVAAMTVSLDAGHVFNGTTLTEVAIQTTGTITAPVGNPRIDRIVVDRSTGAVSVVTGTPAGSPTAPAIPAGKCPVAQVLLQTSSTTITNSMITDERDLAAMGRGLLGDLGTTNSVTNAMLAQMLANTVKVNATGSTANATDLAMGASTILARLASGNIVAATPAQITAMLNVAASYNAITGFLSSSQSFSSSTSASMTITAGQATDSGNTLLFAGTSFSWNITNGNAANGYQGGTTLPNSSTIHFFVIATTSDTTWSASFASTSLTPTLPSGYSGGKYRHVFSLITDSSGVLLAGTMTEILGGGIQYSLAAVITDMNNAATTSANRTLVTMSVPAGVKVLHMARFETNGVGLSLITSPDEADLAVSGVSTSPGADTSNGNGATQFVGLETLTNTNGQIGIRTSNNVTMYAFTRGWKELRRA